MSSYVVGFVVFCLFMGGLIYWAIDKKHDREDTCRDLSSQFVSGGQYGDDFCVDGDGKVVKVF